MSPSGAEVIRQIKQQVQEVDPAEVSEHLGNGVTLIDVRESEEWDRGHIPGAVHVPRGYLESRIEGAVADRDARVVLYCASGQRSALAAHTLKELLGYTDVRSMTGGITLWKDRGYKVEVPKVLTTEQKERYGRHLLLPEVGAEGQAKLLDAKVLLLGAGGLGSPTALYLAAAGVGTLGIVDDDEVDLSNLQRQVIHTTDRDRHAEGRLGRGRRSTRSTRTSKVVKYPVAARRLEHHGDHRRLRRDRRRRRQLPDALPAQRRDGAARHPGRVGLDPRLRRPAVGLQAARRPVLPLPVPGAAAGRARALAAAPTACSACCRARWACCRRPRSSSS